MSVAGGAPAEGADPAAEGAGLLVRRIAHDLATPVGALAVALELDPAADPILREAVARLAALLDLHRSLFGADADAPFDPAVLAPLLGDRRLHVEPGLDAREQRALAALALDAVPLLAAGGSVRLLAGPGGPALALEGRVRPPGEELAAVLAGAPATAPGTVGAALAVRLLGRLRVEPGPAQLLFRAAAAR